MAQMDLEEVSTATTLTLETDSEDMTSATEARAAFATTHAFDSTAHARQVDPDLEKDAWDGITYIHVTARHFMICHVQNVEALKTHKVIASELLPWNKSRVVL